MKNKKIFALLAMTVIASGAMSACGFGSDEPDQVVVATPTPKPTQAPTPTPAPADGQSTTYNSKDKSISITVPDATWANKNDTDKMVSFESPEQGKILILHGAGDEAMAAALIPDSQDIATALEQAADLEPGTDFNILDYSAENVDGVGIYSYTVQYLNDKGGYAYVVNKYFANDNEFYSVAGPVKKGKDDKATEKILNSVKKAVSSFKIKGDSALKSATPEKAANEENKGDTNTDGNTEAPAESQSSEGSGSDGSGSGSTGDAALSDTNQTRTIYDNDDGRPRVIYADGNGGWYDDNGNSYQFLTDEDVYDQDGKDFYYHGEAADVYYMPVE